MKIFYYDTIITRPTKAKEGPTSHEVRLTPQDTNPVFQCLEELTALNKIYLSYHIIYLFGKL